jgi:hypothetical protein
VLLASRAVFRTPSHFRIPLTVHRIDCSSLVTYSLLLVPFPSCPVPFYLNPFVFTPGLTARLHCGARLLSSKFSLASAIIRVLAMWSVAGRLDFVLSFSFSLVSARLYRRSLECAYKKILPGLMEGKQLCAPICSLPHALALLQDAGTSILPLRTHGRASLDLALSVSLIVSPNGIVCPLSIRQTSWWTRTTVRRRQVRQNIWTGDVRLRSHDAGCPCLSRLGDDGNKSAVDETLN